MTKSSKSHRPAAATAVRVRLGPGPHDVVTIQPPAVLPPPARAEAIRRAVQETVAEAVARGGRRWPRAIA